MKSAVKAALVAAGVGGAMLAVPTPSAHAFTYFAVTNTNDSGVGSLRQALDDADTDPGLDGIQFNIPGAGPHVIVPVTNLPGIDQQTVVNGYSEAGSAPPGPGTPAILKVVIDATNVTDGLVLRASDSLLTGLVVHSASSDGIRVEGNRNRIVGNHVGVDPAGLNGLQNGLGIRIVGNSNTVGSQQASGRNVLSGNRLYGVDIDGTGNQVLGNYIGTDATGAVPLGNGSAGVKLSGGANQVGGTNPGARNVVSGNGGAGIDLDSTAGGSVVQGNLIGTDVAGGAAIGNDDGITLLSAGNVIGGAAGARNVISGNAGDGIDVGGFGDQNVVQGNLIGTDITTTVALGNGGDGIDLSTDGNRVGGNVIAANGSDGVHVSGTDNLIETNQIGLGNGRGNAGDGVYLTADRNTVGGLSTPSANLIASNGGAGVVVSGGADENLIMSNSIVSNVGLGIDLGANGPDLNDAQDPDSSANDEQNYPVILGATTVGGVTTISWNLDSLSGTDFRLQFFVVNVCDGSGHGEAKSFLGDAAVTTPAVGGVVTGTTVTPFAAAPGQVVVATATRVVGVAPPVGETSEFSSCVVVV